MFKKSQYLIAIIVCLITVSSVLFIAKAQNNGRSNNFSEQFNFANTEESLLQLIKITVANYLNNPAQERNFRQAVKNQVKEEMQKIGIPQVLIDKILADIDKKWPQLYPQIKEKVLDVINNSANEKKLLEIISPLTKLLLEKVRDELDKLLKPNSNPTVGEIQQIFRQFKQYCQQLPNAPPGSQEQKIMEEVSKNLQDFIKQQIADQLGDLIFNDVVKPFFNQPENQLTIASALKQVIIKQLDDPDTEKKVRQMIKSAVEGELQKMDMPPQLQQQILTALNENWEWLYDRIKLKIILATENEQGELVGKLVKILAPYIQSLDNLSDFKMEDISGQMQDVITQAVKDDISTRVEGLIINKAVIPFLNQWAKQVDKYSLALEEIAKGLKKALQELQSRERKLTLLGIKIATLVEFPNVKRFISTLLWYVEDIQARLRVIKTSLQSLAGTINSQKPYNKQDDNPLILEYAITADLYNIVRNLLYINRKLSSIDRIIKQGPTGVNSTAEARAAREVMKGIGKEYYSPETQKILQQFQELSGKSKMLSKISTDVRFSKALVEVIIKNRKKYTQDQELKRELEEERREIEKRVRECLRKLIKKQQEGIRQELEQIKQQLQQQPQQ